MCGRYTLIANSEAIRLLFEIPAFDERLIVPRYNIAPTQPIVVVRQGATGRDLVPMRWGLIPAWAKDPRTVPLLINARADGIAIKPSFQGAFKYRRCLIPASGFYEWQARGPRAKQPYFVRPADGGLIAFAGVWETWSGADGSEIDTAAIVTTDANLPLTAIHHRMPVILAPNDFAAWLSPDTSAAETLALLKPAPDAHFTAIPISDRVNAVANDDPGLWEERDEDPSDAAANAAEPQQGSLF